MRKGACVEPAEKGDSGRRKRCVSLVRVRPGANPGDLRQVTERGLVTIENPALPRGKRKYSPKGSLLEGRRGRGTGRGALVSWVPA